MLPAILSLSGPTLTGEEQALYRDAKPAGAILFARNIVDPAQVTALTASLRDLLARDLLVLIDQEGGRVARLRPPHWPEFPAASAFAPLFATAPLSGLEAARQNGLALAGVLRPLGINVDCAPVLDVPQPDAHEIIGNRAYGSDPATVGALGGAVLEGLHAGGVLGVIKHIPGHGRARADSHLELPVVDASLEQLEADFAPFRALATKALAAMTAHVTYSALDPERCATNSPAVIAGTIRRDIGFDGLLMTDDLAMKALSGSPADLARQALAAGCDVVLHCNGDLDEMEALAAALPPMTESAAARIARCFKAIQGHPVPDSERAAEHRDRLLALA